ncbi:MAG: permease prefix domain 1-containing protein, partial [Longimicrobiales bacterium]
MMGNRSPLRRLRRCFQRDPAADVDDELEFHVEERVRDHIARGMDPDAARQAVLGRLGDLERV